MIEVFFFHCGHGDTILIRLPDDRWFLIDCFLPEQYGIREKFFRFLDQKKVRTFDFIFQTHPDYDHYHGMQAVISHFLKRGERIKYYLDTGLTARRASDLLRNRPGASEYETLQDRLEEWDKADKVELLGLDARSVPLCPHGYNKQIQFIPIGPDPQEKRRIMSSDLRRLGSDSRVRPEANELSLVVVLSVRINGATLNVLLSADAGTESIRRALEHWAERAPDMGTKVEFDALKIPHHGSIRSRSVDLCTMRHFGTDADTAVVSAGTRRALPDREVLRDYLKKGWLVMSTTTRGSNPGPDLPMTLADRGAVDRGDLSRHTIRLSWSPEGGLSAEPAAAKIGMEDLAEYETASG